MNNSSTSLARFVPASSPSSTSTIRSAWAFSNLDVRFAQRRAQHGHRVLEPILVGDDHVGVALHHQRRAGLSQRLAGQVEAVEQLALGEQRRFRRIDVLCRARRAQLRQHPAADAHRPALGIVDREQQPAPEPVVRGSRLRRAGRGCRSLPEFSPGAAVSRGRRRPWTCRKIQSRSSGEKPSWNRSMLSAVIPRSCK